MNKYTVIYTDFKDRQDLQGVIAKSKQDALNMLYDAGFFDAPRIKSLDVIDEGPLSPAEEKAYKEQTKGKNLPEFTATVINKDGYLRIFPVWDKDLAAARKFVESCEWVANIFDVVPAEK